MFFNWSRKKRYSVSYRNGQDGRYVVFQFKMKKGDILISCKKDPLSDTIFLPSYNRNEEHPSDLSYNETCFAGDIQKMISLMENKEITKDMVFGACDTFIGSHIRKRHRIVDMDIYRIVAEFILLIDAMMKNNTGKGLSEDEKSDIVHNLIERAFYKFTKHLYITHYRIDGEHLKSYLIKT